jgi:hypothetical protein
MTGINAAVSKCARDRSGNTGSPAGAEELERIARSCRCAAGCAQIFLMAEGGFCPAWDP